MAGLLDNKSRMMDTIVTLEGRRQLAQGKMRAEYVSFTDGQTFYEADVASGSTDAGERLYFEAANLLQDAVAFEADDSGLLMATPGLFRDGTGISNGKIVQSDSTDFLSYVSGSVFASSASKLLAASLDSFKKLRIIGSLGQLDDDVEFVLSVNELAFDMTDASPIPAEVGIQKKSVDDVGDLFSDPLLSHVPNFAYLPPVNEPANQSVQPVSLGDFPKLGPGLDFTPSDVMNELAIAAELGQVREITMVETSRASNLFAQFFELTTTDVRKLDVIDYGSFIAPGAKSSTRVFFVGKVFTNSYKASTFLRLFTLVFDNVESGGMF